METLGSAPGIASVVSTQENEKKEGNELNYFNTTEYMLTGSVCVFLPPQKPLRWGKVPILSRYVSCTHPDGELHYFSLRMILLDEVRRFDFEYDDQKGEVKEYTAFVEPDPDWVTEWIAKHSAVAAPKA